MTLSGVRVEGLREFRRDLRRMDKALPVALRGELLKIGHKVAERAQSKMPVVTGRARGSVRAGVSGTNAYVAIGKKSVPYAAWLDFGGTLRPTGHRRNTIRRQPLRMGRYLYPAVEEMRPEVEVAAREAFASVAPRSRIR